MPFAEIHRVMPALRTVSITVSSVCSEDVLVAGQHDLDLPSCLSA